MSRLERSVLVDPAISRSNCNSNWMEAGGDAEGRARLFTADLTGSVTFTNTIGTVLVAWR